MGVLAATLSVSVAQGFYGLVGHPNGAVTPIDEPRVAAARAEHLATKFGGVAAPVAYAAAPALAAAPVAYAAAPAYTYAAGYGYGGPLNLNTQLVGHPNGAVVPLDEPAVAAARAEHLAAKGDSYAAAGPLAVAAPAFAAPVIAAAPAYPYAAGYGYAGPLNLNSQLVAHPNGAVVPVDEPAVAARRAEHFAAQGASYAAAGPAIAAHIPVGGVYAAAAPVAAGYGLAPYGGLVAHPNGAVVPVDEPAVAAARAEHLIALGAFH